MWWVGLLVIGGTMGLTCLSVCQADDALAGDAIPERWRARTLAERYGIEFGEDAALWSARSCVGELGWRDHQACAAIVHVHARRAAQRHETLVATTRAYSRPVSERAPAHRRWVLELTTDPEPPPSWPEGPRWARHRDAFAAMLEHVRGVLTGRHGDPCAHEAPTHHGGHMDALRMRVGGWVRAACLPRARQRFWRRP